MFTGGTGFNTNEMNIKVPQCPSLPFLFWGRVPLHYRKKGTLILTSPLEDLDICLCPPVGFKGNLSLQ